MRGSARYLGNLWQAAVNVSCTTSDGSTRLANRASVRAATIRRRRGRCRANSSPAADRSPPRSRVNSSSVSRSDKRAKFSPLLLNPERTLDRGQVRPEICKKFQRTVLGRGLAGSHYRVCRVGQQAARGFFDSCTASCAPANHGDQEAESSPGRRHSLYRTGAARGLRRWSTGGRNRPPSGYRRPSA